MHEIGPLLSESHHIDFFDAQWRDLFGKCVSIVVYAHFFLSDKKCILLKCAHTFFRIDAHLSILRFFNAIIQNAHIIGGWKQLQ